MAKNKKNAVSEEADEEETGRRRRPSDDEEESEGAPKDKKGKDKKAKKEKAPKEPKEKKAKKEKKPKKPMSAVGGFLMAFLLFILLNVVALGLLYFNIGGFKAPFNGFFNLSPLALEAERSILEDRETILAEREKKLQSDQEQLNIQRDGLLQLEKVINNNKADIEKRENQLKINEAEFDIVREELNGKVANLAATVKDLEQMDVDAAAAILDAMTDQNQILLLLKNMKPAIRSAVLAALPIEKSSVYVSELAGS